MMNRAFTLVELLVVVGIMGLLGTVSVGGYNAMQRGMEERGVMDNVNTLVRTAFERAQIDRQPTAIYFWNETLRSSSQDENEIVVGKAVAVRSQGRLSAVTGGLLIDEFSDFKLTFPPNDNGGGGESGDKDNTMYLYCLDDLGDIKRSEVSAQVPQDPKEIQTMPLNGRPNDSVGNGIIELWGLKIVDQNGVSWKTGSVYGMEFAEITLPHGYIFGNNYSTSVEDPIREPTPRSISFSVGRVKSAGNRVTEVDDGGRITVYSLRPDGSGGLKAQSVGKSDSPLDKQKL